MSTFMLRTEDVNRKWYVIDAAGKTLGKVAVTAATILNGKHKPEYTPHVDCGDCVIVINAEKVVLTGKKLEQKTYYHHSGYEHTRSTICTRQKGFYIKARNRT